MGERELDVCLGGVCSPRCFLFLFGLYKGGRGIEEEKGEKREGKNMQVLVFLTYHVKVYPVMW